MIRGINKDISPETAEKGLRKVFSSRFDRESKRLLNVQCFKVTENLESLVKERKDLKKKLKKIVKHNKEDNGRE